LFTPIQVAGFPGGPKNSGYLTLNSVGSTALNVTGATATGANLTASVSGNTIAVTADPTGLTPGIYNGSVTISSNAANNALIAIPVDFTVEAAGVPLIYANGIVNIANYAQEPASPGDLLVIFGDQLAPVGTFQQNTGAPPLATTLAGVQVLVNGVPAPLYYVLPGQIAFQLPYEAASSPLSTVQVVSGSTSGNTRSLTVNAAMPRLMTWVPQIIAGNYGIIVNQDGTLTLPASTSVAGFTTRPARAGDGLTIYAVGLGQTTPGAVTGAPASASPLEQIGGVTVTFGGGFQGTPVTATAFFAGLTPTEVGLYQINVVVPSTVPLGALVPVTIDVGGVFSNTVYIATSK
jgi:uncharacterized protein (TIGR03437 family)